MIGKDPGTPKITRLRIIQLFEANFNIFRKTGEEKRYSAQSAQRGAPWLGPTPHRTRSHHANAIDCKSVQTL
jgi:hypothetical protein